MIKDIEVAKRTRKNRWTEHKNENSIQADDSYRCGQWEQKRNFVHKGQDIS